MSTPIVRPDSRRLRDWWYTPVLIAAGILLPGWFAPPAHADVNSDAFIMTLDSEGIAYTSETEAIKAGHAICDYLDTGASIYSATLLVYNNTPLDMYHAGYFVGASTGAFCSWHAPNVGVV